MPERPTESGCGSRLGANSKWNDAVWVQFSDARANGSSVYPLNSTSGLLVNLATDSGAGSLNAWGWENSAYWLSQSTTVSFANSGAHTLRIQVREDGVEFDQIVLSPATIFGGPARCCDKRHDNSHSQSVRRYSSSAVATALGRSGMMVSPRASMATSAAIFLARPAGVFMLLVRNASANRF